MRQNKLSLEDILVVAMEADPGKIVVNLIKAFQMYE